MSEITPDAARVDEDAADLPQGVRSALLHLYDNAFLQNHPLTVLLAAGAAGDRLTHAQALRRTLLDCIERLRPHATAHGDAARAYAVLTYRCVDGLTIEEIEQKLGLSRRQTYREFTKGVEAVAAQLQDRLGVRADQTLPISTLAPDEHAPNSRQALAEEELARLGKEARREAMALPDIVHGVCHLLEARLQRRGMAVQTAALASAPTVLADRTLLRQALLNLLSYALDVLPDGASLALAVEERPGMVHLHLRQASADAATGQGVSPAHQREGVALTVAQSLLAAQHGRLTLDETPQAWAAEIMLPTAQTPTVLIIDDNRTLIELFRRYLAGHRVVVAGAGSGDEALAWLRQSAAQAVVLDVMMPHQDGWEVLQALRKEPALAATPIIVCSVLREHDLALSLGASDTLVKPVSQPALLDVLRRWLGTLLPLA
ncbi:response regulator [Caldilinea sp.]|uniref:response regulator n=1 Tax=Caldilinea sp. TaxID=2293560 RepID=UPI002B537A14|nr:response regulator [Caldilinea sp.]HRA66743.1 response regulator [Caldilinea sp.]